MRVGSLSDSRHSHLRSFQAGSLTVNEALKSRRSDGRYSRLSDARVVGSYAENRPVVAVRIRDALSANIPVLEAISGLGGHAWRFNIGRLSSRGYRALRLIL